MRCPFDTRKFASFCFAVLGLFLSVLMSWDASAQTYTLDGKLEVTDGTTVGGDFKLSGAPLSDELGLRILFLDDSGNVKTLTSPVLEGLRLMLTEPSCRPSSVTARGNGSSISNCMLYNGNGRLVGIWKSLENCLPTDHLEPGMYFQNCSDGSVQKIVIE